MLPSAWTRAVSQGRLLRSSPQGGGSPGSTCRPAHTRAQGLESLPVPWSQGHGRDIHSPSGILPANTGCPKAARGQGQDTVIALVAQEAPKVQGGDMGTDRANDRCRPPGPPR